MMKLKYIMMLGLMIATFSSCKKDLDLQPTDLFSDGNAFLTMDDIQQGANGAYGMYGTYLNDVYVNALASDEGKLGRDNSGQGSFTYRYQYGADASTGGDVIAAFYGYYRLIDQVNRILPRIPEVTALPSQEARRSVLQGQMLALRGIAHFGLLQAYSGNYNPSDPLGIPVMLASDPLALPARNTMGEVMAQIESDLSTAKTLTAGQPFSDTVMNPVNIAAYQARIALYRRDYDAAVQYATEVINSNVKPLVSGDDFMMIWTDEADFETLFRIRYVNSSAVGSIFTTTGGSIYVAPSDKLVGSYDPADVRFTSYIGFDGTDAYVNKYFISDRGGRIVDLKAARIAEMYLIRAEANAKKGSPDLDAAAADLNFLRSKRIAGYTDETFPNAATLIEAILMERFKELAFEGFRFYDLKRNNLPVERLDSDASPLWQTLPAGDFRFVLPIPAQELLANPNMDPNPGY